MCCLALWMPAGECPNSFGWPRNLYSTAPWGELTIPLACTTLTMQHRAIWVVRPSTWNRLQYVLYEGWKEWQVTLLNNNNSSFFLLLSQILWIFYVCMWRQLKTAFGSMHCLSCGFCLHSWQTLFKPRFVWEHLEYLFHWEVPCKSSVLILYIFVINCFYFSYKYLLYHLWYRFLKVASKLQSRTWTF